MQKVIVIVGQTATGKSELAVKIAKMVGGEVISADSRQIYKGLDLGTGKITKEKMKGIPHHLLDVVNPKNKFTVTEYKALAEKKIREILARGRVPIICGGTGFYIDAITKGIIFPEVPPNKKLRNILSKKTEKELFEILKNLDRNRSLNIDPKNKVRLIRAIEIAKYMGKVPPIKFSIPSCEFIKIGLTVPEKTLKRKILLRLRKRIRSGMAIEIYNLRKKGVPWKRFIELGFDQKFVALYLKKKINEQEMLASLMKGNWQYAKRQMTWFKRDRDIKWFNPREIREIKKYTKEKLIS